MNISATEVRELMRRLTNPTTPTEQALALGTVRQLLLTGGRSNVVGGSPALTDAEWQQLTQLYRERWAEVEARERQQALEPPAPVRPALDLSLLELSLPQSGREFLISSGGGAVMGVAAGALVGAVAGNARRGAAVGALIGAVAPLVSRPVRAVSPLPFWVLGMLAGGGFRQ